MWLMSVDTVLQRAIQTIVFARNLNSVRVDRETFKNADAFFDHRFAGNGESRLLDIRGPFIEVVQPPQTSTQTWIELCDELNIHTALGKAVTEVLFGGSESGRLYLHQEQALRRALANDGRGLILSVPTATGKTESFLLPVIQHCLTNKVGPNRSPLRAIIIYPTKTLEADQLNRMLRLIYAVNRNGNSGKLLRIGIWDGDTPWEVVGSRPTGNESEDAGLEVPPLKVGDSVRGLECPHPDCRRKGSPKLAACLPESGWQLTCPNHPADRIMEISYARNALGQTTGAVDIVLTTPESLDHALASPGSKLRRHLQKSNVRHIIYDEAHIWRGASGTAIRQLNQRLTAKFRQPQPACQVLLASATVAEPGTLYTDLTGEEGQVIAFTPTTVTSHKGPLTLPAEWRPIDLLQLMEGLTEGSANEDIRSALRSMGLATPEGFTEAGMRLQKQIQSSLSSGQSLEQVVVEGQAFREAWKAILLASLPTLWGGLWQQDGDNLHLKMVSWDVLRERVTTAVPEILAARVDECLHALLSYGRGAGLFVDRYHLFTVPPIGVFFSPQTQKLYSTPFPPEGLEEAPFSEPVPLPELGMCNCGQPYIALLRGVHEPWLDLPVFRGMLPSDHRLRVALSDTDQIGIYWPVGHQVTWGTNPYDRSELMPKRQGVVRQRCSGCRQLLSESMLKSGTEEGFRYDRGYPRPARLHVESFVNYLLTAAVPESHVGRVLAITDGRNLAGRIARNFLRDDTKRLGASGLFIHHLLTHGPMPSVELHEAMRCIKDRRPAGVVWQRLMTDVYGEPGPHFRSPIRQALSDVVFDDAFIDRYRWIVLDYALLIPEALQNDSDLSDFEQLAAWNLFADCAIKRPELPIRPLSDTGSDVVEDDDDDDPLYEEEPSSAGAKHQRFITRKRLGDQFIRRWTLPKIGLKTGLGRTQLETVFNKVFDMLVDIGFFRAVPGETLQEWVMNCGLVGQPMQDWLAYHDLTLAQGRPSGAYTYETRRGDWLVGVSRSRTYCQECGKSWFGRFPLCYACGNNNRSRLIWHDPQKTPYAEAGDRLQALLPPLLEAVEKGEPAPIRTVEALRAGLDPTDRALVEDAFRKGRLNVLAATSLMELGIDIGRLDMLLQHGVPPTFTNYIQRSGRVGRSLGRPAWVFNVLRPNNPIDMYFFGDLEKRFFRDITPIWIPKATDAQAVAAAQVMSELLSQLAAGSRNSDDADGYTTHWKSPQTGQVRPVQQAIAYVNSQVSQHRDSLIDRLIRFGFDQAGANDLLDRLLNASEESKKNPPTGSHLQRVESMLERLTMQGAGANATTRAIEKLINYPILLGYVGMFGLYRGAGDQFVVRLRMPNDKFTMETRGAEQLLRECFPGPRRNENGGFFYRGMTMWRITEMVGEETSASQVVQYCDNAKCDLCGMAFSRLNKCPTCSTTLTQVRTAEPADCIAQPITGFQATDPRVSALTTSVIAPDQLPSSWIECGTLGRLGWSAQAKVTHTVAMFYEGLTRSYQSSRIHVPNPQHSGDYCAGVHQFVPIASLRIPRARFTSVDGLLDTAKIWNCYTAFRQAVGVLLRRDSSDYSTNWDVDDESVYLTVADAHTGGTGLARQWHSYLSEDQGQRLSNHLNELANCPHCNRYCHFCLLHERMAPHIIDVLNRHLIMDVFGLAGVTTIV